MLYERFAVPAVATLTENAVRSILPPPPDPPPPPLLVEAAPGRALTIQQSAKYGGLFSW